jgi:hypothetical protein
MNWIDLNKRMIANGLTPTMIPDIQNLMHVPPTVDTSKKGHDNQLAQLNVFRTLRERLHDDHLTAQWRNSDAKCTDPICNAWRNGLAKKKPATTPKQKKVAKPAKRVHESSLPPTTLAIRHGIIIQMLKRGASIKDIRRKFRSLSKASLAAYQAHITRGTYS